MNGGSLTISVPHAGRVYFGISRNASYEAAKRGDIPTIRVGRLLRVPVAAMEQRLVDAALGAGTPFEGLRSSEPVGRDENGTRRVSR